MGLFDSLKRLLGEDTVKASKATPPRSSTSTSTSTPATSAAVSSSTTQSLDDEVRALLAAEQKIAAIKRVREVLGLGLAEAKEHVEAIERGESPTSTSSTSSTSSSSTSWQEEAKAAVAAGNAILAIKIVRDATGLSLKAAKDAVDEFQRSGVFAAAAPASLPAAGADEVVALIQADRLIEAIKRHRELMGLSLKDTKDVVELLAEQLERGER